MATSTKGTAWKEIPVKFAFLLVWVIPVVIGFLAFMVWSGLVIGWAAAQMLMEKTD